MSAKFQKLVLDFGPIIPYSWPMDRPLKVGHEADMSDTSSNPSNTLSGPINMIEAILRMAEEDAELVANWLSAMGISTPSTNKTQNYFPPTLLLGIGRAMRLLVWERQGIRLHIDAGLPESKVVLQQVLNCVYADDIDQLNGLVDKLSGPILELAISQLAWSGPEQLGGDVIVQRPEEDEFLDAIAELLWKYQDFGDENEPR